MRKVNAICATCDGWCHTEVVVDGDHVHSVRAIDPRPLHADLCMKGVEAPRQQRQPDRLLHPLRRVGERGSGRFEQTTWDEALDDIGARLARVIDQYGSEAFAVSTSPWNTTADNGASRRFMNLVGSPNWISPVALCAGNTAAVNRLVYGWFPVADIDNAKCIVLFGHNPKQHSWTPVYNSIRRAQMNGAKLIVLDPRRSENAECADLWLPIRPGTDAVMSFAWLHTIIEEELYDRLVVENYTHGFNEFRERVAQYPPEHAAAITGVDAELIREAARLYATNGPAVIPWTPVTDQQRNSTSAIRLHCALRAVTGNLDIPGGELLQGFNPDFVTESELELHSLLSPKQKAKQLGADKHPVFTYRGMEALREPTQQVWGTEWANILSGSYMANPSATFRAMADSDPYPVKAFFSLGNNTLMSYANMQLIYRALMNQDLVVVHEHFMTPTAQLADYVLPGDSWLERPALLDGMGWRSTFRFSEQAVPAPGECRDVYDLWRQLAVRLGYESAFPWPTLNDLLDYRCSRVSESFAELAANELQRAPQPRFRKYEETGFATPTGKIELYSTVLEQLDCDPLPYFRDDPEPPEGFDLMLFTGVRDDEFFQTGGKNIAKFRERKPEPESHFSAAEARRRGLTTGDWVSIETVNGAISLKVKISERQPDGIIRVPHGWWKPELSDDASLLFGVWEFADALICPDTPDYLDREQGIPHLKGMACKVTRLDEPPQPRRQDQVAGLERHGD